MKTTPLFLPFLVLAAAIGHSSAATLVLSNGSFETSTGTSITGWTVSGMNSSAEDALVTPGSSSAQNTQFGSRYARFEDNGSTLAQQIGGGHTISAGTYTLTWYSTDAFDDAAAALGGRSITGGLYVGGVSSTVLLGGTATTVSAATINSLNNLGSAGTQFTYTFTVAPGDVNIGQNLSARFSSGDTAGAGFEPPSTT